MNWKPRVSISTFSSITAFRECANHATAGEKDGDQYCANSKQHANDPANPSGFPRLTALPTFSFGLSRTNPLF
jgi:hypothetical protein